MDLASEPGVVPTHAHLPTNVDLIVELLEFADEASSLGDVLTRLTERLVSAFGSHRGFALLAPDVHHAGIPERWCPPDTLADVLRRLQPSIHDAICVDRAGTRRLDRQAVASLAHDVPSFNQCLWSI